MNPSQLQQIKRHLIGLLQAVEDNIEIKDDAIQIGEDLHYYDNRGRIVEIKIVRKLDKVKKI
jgi:hypothetical protein